MKLFSRSSAPVTHLQIEGMSCGACVGHVERALKSVGGVTSAQVDLAKNSAQVSGDAPLEKLIEAVEEAGYSAKTV